MARLSDRAAAVIFAHNHPSGDPKPSDIDVKTHKQLTEAGKILGLRILDHIIVTQKGYFSFQDAELIG
ncbi:JAB domain-containing protein [Thermodesulfobacteriota bacterium]